MFLSPIANAVGTSPGTPPGEAGAVNCTVMHGACCNAVTPEADLHLGAADNNEFGNAA